MDNLTLTVSEFVALVNQTLEYAYPYVTIEGEVSGSRVSKNQWVYFDLKDEAARINCFMSVFNLTTALEDGMKIKLRGVPKLHAKYGFSVTAQTLRPVGEGSIKRAYELLKKRLDAEGLFAPERKRILPRFPQKIGIVSSEQAAGYRDFLKILNERWQGMTLALIDAQVQGESAPTQIVAGISQFNQMPEPVEVLVLLRGGGSADDLQAFNSELVARAVAASRIPTLVGVGHETDTTLADLAADVRASTPSNAAEILVPDRGEIARELDSNGQFIARVVSGWVQQRDLRVKHLAAALSYATQNPMKQLKQNSRQLISNIHLLLQSIDRHILSLGKLLNSYNPRSVLRHGYGIVRSSKGLVKDASKVKTGDTLVIELIDALIKAGVTNVTKKH